MVRGKNNNNKTFLSKFPLFRASDKITVVDSLFTSFLWGVIHGKPSTTVNKEFLKGVYCSNCPGNGVMAGMCCDFLHERCVFPWKVRAVWSLFEMALCWWMTNARDEATRFQAHLPWIIRIPLSWAPNQHQINRRRSVGWNKRQSWWRREVIQTGKPVLRGQESGWAHTCDTRDIRFG